VIESRTAETLRNKRDEIARSIDNYEKKLAQARADLAHVDAAIAIFATGEDASPLRHTLTFIGCLNAAKWLRSAERR
jgi:hypothetical protein